MNFRQNFKLIVMFLLATSLAVSCAGKKGKTNSSFKLTLGGISSAYVSGGLMLYGKMLNGPSRFGKKVDASGTVSLELNNGSWEFFAIAWDGASDMQVASVLRCGKAAGVFAGGDATVSLNLDNATCNDSIFHKDTAKIDTTTFAPNVAFPQANIMTCDRNWVTAPTFYGSFNCDGVGFGAIDSYKVFLPEFIDDGGGPQIVNLGLQTDCQETNPTNVHPTISANGATNNFSSRFPMGRPGSPFLTLVKGFLGSTDCGTTKVARGFLDRIFPEGIGTAPLGFHDTGTTNFRLFDQAQDGEVCGVTGGAANPNDFFSAGNGVGHPYIICSREQLEAFANPSNYNTSLPDDSVALRGAHFKLYAPIDFNSSAFDGIGDGTQGYTGKFYGRKYVISNIFNMTLADVDNIGLFRYVGASAHIDDLILRNVFFECDDTDNSGDCNQMGALAGQVDGGGATATSFTNIRVQGNIFGGRNIGGVIGLINGSSLGTELTDIHFVGSAEAEPAISSLANVGGIVGYASDTNVSMSSAKCHVYGDGLVAGGLVGNLSILSSSSSITSSLARCEVRADRQIGGLVGVVGTSATVSNTYSFPNLQAHCSGGCDAGANKVSLGGLVGENNGTITLSFAAYASINMNSGGGTNDPMAFMGGLVGFNNGTCSPTNNFFTKFDNNSVNLFGSTNGGGCGTYHNSTSIYNFTTFNTAGWTIVNTSGSGPQWNLPSSAEGFDVPRLSWEYDKELEIPYLQRPCEANSYAISGSGTLIDPYMICKMTDFLSMTSGPNYKLKKDLEFLGAPISSPTKFGPGTYKLDGDGHSLIGLTFEISGGTPSKIGLYDSLMSGSKISNINLIGLNYKTMTSIGMNGTFLQAGLLAGTNQGVIENIFIEQSGLNLVMNNGTNIDNVSPMIGGLVGTNHGLIQYVFGGPHVSIKDTNLYMNGGETLYVGGLVGKNFATGAIKYSGLYSSVGHNAGATGFNAKSNENFYASVVAINSGTIEQVSAEGRVEIWNFDNSGAGGSFGGISVRNEGTINNSSSQVTFRQTGGGTSSKFSGITVENVAGASISKSYYAPSPWDLNDFDGSSAFTRPVNLAGIAVSNTGTLNDSYCFADLNSGSPDEGLLGCLDLHPSTPNFYFTATANGFDLTYDDSSSVSQTLSSVGWNVDDDFLYGTAIWTIEDYDRPPRLRVSDPFRDEVLNAPPIF